MLAIYTPSVGVPSETFIRRHIEGLAPERAVVVCDKVLSPPAGNWSVNCPTYITTTRLHWHLGRMLRRWSNGRLFPFGDPLRMFLKRHQVDVVLGEFMDQFLPVRKVLAGSGLRVFVHAHGRDVSVSLRDPLVRRAYLDYAGIQGIITVSKLSRDMLIALGLPGEKIHVVPCGVEVPAFNQKPCGIVETVRCLAVGRMTPKKAPLLLLESFARACKAERRLRLDYIGDGELYSEANSFVQRERLADVVTLYGKQGNDFVLKRMESSDIFLQHSVTDPVTGDMEGFPVAILEAMASGLPVVSTLHAGISEQVVEGETGYLVREGDTEAMAERIVHMARSADLRVTMGAAAHKRAKEHFSWEINCRKLREVMSLNR